MIKNLSAFLLVTLLVTSAFGQQCKNAAGKTVTWWVMLLYPGSVSTGFAYFDSTFATGSSFQVNLNEPDTPGTPLTNTLTQINTMGMQSIAWNDQKPSGQTSSTKAHSKAVASYDDASSLGFLFDHSIPQYPAFIGTTINITIPSSQQIYGQHVFCLSLNKTMINDMISKVMPITPYYYANTLNNPNAITNLLNAGQISAPDYTHLFTYSSYVLNNTQAKFIFKNGKVNGSIFEDGLNVMLNSRIIAETWGRPIQPQWCGTPNVGNVVTLQITPTIGWKETQDHSKWAYAVDNNYCCFGDMNRMTSQWARGGAFYCINSPTLNAAIKRIVTSTTVC